MKKIIALIVPMLLLSTLTLADGGCPQGKAWGWNNHEHKWECIPICIPDWQTGEWGACVDGHQYRTVTDLNECGTTFGKPATVQHCTTPCVPTGELTCSAWSACVDNSQTRTCTDSCGNPVADQTQSCTITCTPNWQIGAWSQCAAGLQTRTIIDLNSCGIANTLPTEQTCDMPCVPVKVYSDWSACIDSTQSRTWTDNCGGSGSETQTCTVPICTPNVVCSSYGDCIDGKQTRGCSDGCGEVTTQSRDCQSDSEIVVGGARIPDYGALLPWYGMTQDTFWDNACKLNTFIPKQCLPGYTGTLKCYLPKQVLLICMDDVTEEMKIAFMTNPFGTYDKASEWLYYHYAFSWWKLRPEIIGGLLPTL